VVGAGSVRFRRGPLRRFALQRNAHGAPDSESGWLPTWPLIRPGALLNLRESTPVRGGYPRQGLSVPPSGPVPGILLPQPQPSSPSYDQYS
jgi:hypothetical protein